MIVFDTHKHFFYSTLINDETHFSGFGTRLLGNMTDTDAIQDYFKSIDCRYKLLGVPAQKHTTNIESDISFNSKHDTRNVVFLKNRDGFTTKQSGVALMVWTADCVPIMYADKKNGVIGISHQGWRGTVDGMVGKMVASLLKSGAEKESLRIVIGPSIGACCYDVDDERIELFRQSYPEFLSKIIQTRKGKTYLNLLNTNYLLLQSEGIRKEQIDFFPFCTKCDTKRFFSYRNEGEDHGNMINFIMKLS